MLDLEDSFAGAARVGECGGIQVLHEVDGCIHGWADASGVVEDADASAEPPLGIVGMREGHRDQVATRSRPQRGNVNVDGPPGPETTGATESLAPGETP